MEDFDRDELPRKQNTREARLLKSKKARKRRAELREIKENQWDRALHD